MKDLIRVFNKQAVTSSLQIAEHFGKRHTHVLRVIEKAIRTQPKIGLSEKPFHRATYTDASGRKNPMYYLNRDGFSFIVMGFTGKKADEWKWKYIGAFNAMERALMEKSSPVWQTVRAYSKKARRLETDAIKIFIGYAFGQGSRHADRYYEAFTKMANKALGITSRDNLTVEGLNRLAIVETLIASQIQLGMAAGKHYKQIYKDCREKVLTHTALLQAVGEIAA